MRERLATETPLFITASDSAGAVTAQMRTSSGWDDGLVDLKLAGGELVARAGAGGGLSLRALSLELDTITIPASLTGHAAQLTRPHLEITAPIELPAAWAGDDSAVADTALTFELSWQLTVDGVGLPLGAPSLPPLPVKLQLSGDGSRITAELRIHAPGELWSWADLIKLTDLELVLGADTSAQGRIIHQNGERDQAARGRSGRTPGSAARSVLDVRDEREPAVRHEMPAMRRSQPAVW